MNGRHRLRWSINWVRRQQVRTPTLYPHHIYHQHWWCIPAILLNDASAVLRRKGPDWPPIGLLHHRSTNLCFRTSTALTERRHHRRHELCHCARTTDWLRGPAPSKFLHWKDDVQSLIRYAMGLRRSTPTCATVLPRVHSSYKLVSNSNANISRSPYWLVAHGRHDGARHNIIKLHDSDYDVDGHMAKIHNSLARMNADNETQGSILECFSKKHIKRTMVATSIFFIQNASGSAWVVGYMSYFMQLGGMSAAQSFDTTAGMSGLSWSWATCAVGCFVGAISVAVIRCAVRHRHANGCLVPGRGPGPVSKRTMRFWGQGRLHGYIGRFGKKKSPYMRHFRTTRLIGPFFFLQSYQGTLGSAAWPISAESPTSRLRAPTQALGTMMNELSSCIWSFSIPYIINPDQANLGGKIAFIFGRVLIFAFAFA